MNNSKEKKQSAQKPKMSFWQMFNMSLGFLGIQFGFALQTGNASRILQTLGAHVEHLTWFWLGAPLTGMIIQPIIGHYSDGTWTKLGRRRPYFLTGAFIAAVALFCMPNASLFAMPVFAGAAMLIVMDASFNVGMEPFRALVADNLPDEQHNHGFSIQTSLIGVGAVLGSLLPYILANVFGMAKTAGQGIVPQNVKYSFYTGAVVLVLSVLWSVTRTKEYSPEEFESFHRDEIAKEKSKPKMGAAKEIFSSFIHMPKTMRQLAVVQFFSYYALFSMWVFTTPAIADNVFHIPQTDTSSERYNNAANWVDIMFGVYNIISAIYALILPQILKHTGRRKIYAISLIAGGIALISIFFVHNKYLLILPMIGIGIASGALAIPYAMLSGSIPRIKTGVYMGIFNLTITIPQILNGVIGGIIVKHLFHNKPIYALLMAGVLLFIAAASVGLVKSEGGETEAA